MQSQAHKILIQQGVKILKNMWISDRSIFIESNIPKNLRPKYCIPDVVGTLEGHRLIAVECGELRASNIRNKKLYNFYDKVIHLPYLKPTKYTSPEQAFGKWIKRMEYRLILWPRRQKRRREKTRKKEEAIKTALRGLGFE